MAEELTRNKIYEGAQNTNPHPSTVACFEKNYSPLMISEMELSPNMKNGSLVCIIYKFNLRKLLVASVEDAPGIKTVGSLVKRHAKTGKRHHSSNSVNTTRVVSSFTNSFKLSFKLHLWKGCPVRRK